MSYAREYCSLCGRMIRAFDTTFTEDGQVHLGCLELLGRPHDTRSARRRARTPDYNAPSLAQQEYIRKTARCYATLFHNPDRRRQVRPRFTHKRSYT